MGGEGGRELGWFVATPSLVDSKTEDLFLFQNRNVTFWVKQRANISPGG